MSDYIVVDGELKHYGVRGMRWGVRRDRKKLAKASTNEQRDKAIRSLNNRREKGSNKVDKLSKKTPKLEVRARDAELKYDAKAASMYARAAKMRRKAYGAFTPKWLSDNRLFKSGKLYAQADDIKSRSNKAKAKLKHNKKMIEAFQIEINNIDQALVSVGKDYADKLLHE